MLSKLCAVNRRAVQEATEQMKEKKAIMVYNITVGGRICKLCLPATSPFKGKIKK